MPGNQLQRASTAKRADARKNIAAIIDAATTCLARDPDVSVTDIAKAAGVGRVTLYGHFESRRALVALVVDRAMWQTEEELEVLDLGGDPRAALVRLVETTWRLTHRYGALIIAAEKVMPPEKVREAHHKPIDRWRRLLRRGRDHGCFRGDMPLDWQVTMIHSIIHSASSTVHRGEITASQVPTLIRDTILAALTPLGAVVSNP